MDIDTWVRGLLASVDTILTPEYTAAIQLINTDQVDYLQRILDQKELLARAMSATMVPLYEKDAGLDPANVREAFYQQMLARLSAAYDVRAGIQFRADVVADVRDPLATQPPRLFGPVRQLLVAGGTRLRSDITLTSPKLTLDTATRVPLPILLSTPDTVEQFGAVSSTLKLNLAWEADMIEHQVSAPDDIAGYVASSWLSFLRPQPSLVSRLGDVDVPLVMRAFPDSPAMTTQDGRASVENATDLADMTLWTYTFTWSLPFHYGQDRVHGEVFFNGTGSSPRTQSDDVFEALAEFVTVYPDVRRDLEGIVAKVDVHSDAETLRQARVAVTAYLDLLGRVTATIPPAGLGVLTSDPAPDPDWTFEISESGQRVLGSGAPVLALYVKVQAAPLVNAGDPVVYVGDPRYKPDPRPEPDGYGFFYRDDEGAYLTYADGQKIADRIMYLPRLDVIQRQCATVGLRVTRNEESATSGHRLAEPFVYTTATARYPQPLTPTLGSHQPVDIATLGTGGPRRPLREQFAALFDALFHDLPPEVKTATIQCELVYRYELAAGYDPIELPVFFQAPLLIHVAERQVMVDAWAAAFDRWFDATAPSEVNGQLHLDLTIMSDRTGSTMPLLRLHHVVLALDDIARNGA